MNKKRKKPSVDLKDGVLELDDDSSTSTLDTESHNQDASNAKPNGIKESLKKMIQINKGSEKEEKSKLPKIVVNDSVSEKQKVKVSPLESALVQTDNLKIAQNKIKSLEEELNLARIENEKLHVAGEIVNHRNQELLSVNQKLELKIENSKEEFQKEIQLLKDSNAAKTVKNDELMQKNKEFDSHLNSKISKIGRRERELENRLEIVKKENEVLIKSKNEDLMHLNRQVDQLKMEIENFRKKGVELNKEISEKDEMATKTIKALKMALNVLDKEIDPSVKLKKVD